MAAQVASLFKRQADELEGMKETKNFFAYGTLMCDEIMAEVSGVCPRPVPATLWGYRRLRVKAEPYPAVVPNIGCCVDGIAYQHVPPSAWGRLDRFEGEMYSREIVQVRLSSGSAVRAATDVLRPQFGVIWTKQNGIPPSFFVKENDASADRTRGTWLCGETIKYGAVAPP